VATGDWASFDASNSTDNDRIRAYNWTIANEDGEVVDRGTNAGGSTATSSLNPGRTTSRSRSATG